MTVLDALQLLDWLLFIGAGVACGLFSVSFDMGRIAVAVIPALAAFGAVAGLAPDFCAGGNSHLVAIFAICLLFGLTFGRKRAGLAAVGALASALLTEAMLIIASIKAVWYVPYVFELLAALFCGLLVAAFAEGPARIVTDEQYEMLSLSEMGRRLKGAVLMVLALLATNTAVLYLLRNYSAFDFPARYVSVAASAAVCATALCGGKLIFQKKLAEYDIMIDWKQKDDLANFMNLVRSQRHDFNFHLSTVSRMLDGGRIDECREYIHAMTYEADQINRIFPVFNIAISALLLSFYEMAKLHGIRIEYVILSDLSKIKCSVYEVNKILGNLLQNAIDEVAAHEDEKREIRVLISKRSGRSVMKVANRFAGDAQRFRNVFQFNYSTKAGHEGIGLSTIRRVAQKYGGDIYLEVEEDIVSFIAVVPNTF